VRGNCSDESPERIGSSSDDVSSRQWVTNASEVLDMNIDSFSNVKCTNCGALIPITQALQHQLSEEAEARVRQEIARREQVLSAKESALVTREQNLTVAEARIESAVQERLASERSRLEENVKAAARNDLEIELSALRTQVESAGKKLREAQQSELELRVQRRELEQQKEALEVEVVRRVDVERRKTREEAHRQVALKEEEVAARQSALAAREAQIAAAQSSLEARVQERLAAERSGLEEAARAAAANENQLELQDLRARAVDTEKRLKEAQDSELRLRAEKRTLESERAALQVEVSRRVDAELAQVREAATRAADEQHRLKDAEKDRKLQEVLRLNEELRRKVQQGSQQTQGEVLEETLEELLGSQFSFDVFEPVCKGTRGADVIQRVYTRSGQKSGAILWESKNTKNWSDGWIDKVKDDQREAKADVAVIVSTALPKGVSGFAYRDGVWVAEARVAVGLATALRNGLTELAATKRAVASKNEAVEVLFTYLTGPEFRQRVEAIVRTFADMQGDLEEEKRVAARRWAKREKQIARVIESTGAMYGDLQGLLGASMPAIALLETSDVEEASSEEPRPVPDDDDIPF
jgi:hypothetical protein